MNSKELAKTESFLNGSSRTHKLSDSISIQHVSRVEFTTGGHALNVRYGIASPNGEYQNQALIASFNEAVTKLGEKE